MPYRVQLPPLQGYKLGGITVASPIREKPATLATPATPLDPYAERARAALREINSRDYPAGMILWLETAYPQLYEELTSRIPDEIHVCWAAHDPLAEFDAILARLVETHRLACQLYREHLG